MVISEHGNLPAQLSLLADSPARTSARPEKARVSKAIVPSSGLSSFATSELQDRVGSLLRTCLLCALEGATPYSLVWKRKVTPAGRSWWVLGRSALRIDATESLFWPTPAAAQAGQGQNEPDGRRGQTLVGAARNQDWKTPTVPNGGRCPKEITETGIRPDGSKGQVDLQHQVRMTDWATPKGSVSGPDYARTARAQSGGDDLATQVARNWPSPTVMDAAGFCGKLDEGRTSPNSGRTLTGKVLESEGQSPHAEFWTSPTVSQGWNDPEKVAQGKFGQTLLGQVMGKTWPSPAARDWRSGKGRKENGHSPQLPEVVKGQLNPDWVECLMGWPVGWTDISGRRDPENHSTTGSQAELSLECREGPSG